MDRLRRAPVCTSDASPSPGQTQGWATVTTWTLAATCTTVSSCTMSWTLPTSVLLLGAMARALPHDPLSGMAHLCPPISRQTTTRSSAYLTWPCPSAKQLLLNEEVNCDNLFLLADCRCDPSRRVVCFRVISCRRFPFDLPLDPIFADSSIASSLNRCIKC